MHTYRPQVHFKPADLVLLLQYTGVRTYRQNPILLIISTAEVQPPPNVLRTAAHRFTPHDVDTASLEAMHGGARRATRGSAELYAEGRVLGIGHEVELLVEMPTEIEDETKNEWIDKRATIIKVESHRYLVHIEVDLANNGKVAWFESARVRRAPRASYGHFTPRHGGIPRDAQTMQRQVGPYLDRGLLDAGIFDHARGRG